VLSGLGGNDFFKNEFDFGLYDIVDGGAGFDIIEQKRDWHRFSNFTPANGIEGLTIVNPNNGTRRVQGEGVSDNVLDFSGITHVNGVATLGGLGLDIRGLGGADTIIGTPGDDTISGGDGNDTIAGLAGNDLINGDSGTDSIEGGHGNDTIDGGTGVDTTLGGEGDDVFNANFSDHVFDSILGGTGTNTIRLNPGRNQSDPIVLSSFTPANQIQQLQGGSRVSGTTGNDILDFSAVTAWTTGRRIDAGDGDDFVQAPSGISGFTINGGSGRDTIFGSDFADVIDGGLDDDILNALAGDDLIRGGSGFNQLTGGLGRDTFFFHDIIEGTSNQQIADFDAFDFLKFQWPVSQVLVYGTSPVSRRFVWDATIGVLYLPNGRQLSLSIGFDLLQSQLLFGNW
jgi:Ca2+-binding RTX toxin-like protein